MSKLSNSFPISVLNELFFYHHTHLPHFS
jgi:hypothetical protein